MKTWYEINNRSKTEPAEVLLFDFIGEFGVQAKDFLNEVRALPNKAINVNIKSEGGSVFEGLEIYNGLKDLDAEVTTTVNTLAASIAGVILQAGDTRRIKPTGFVMVHRAFGGFLGNADQLRQKADMLENVESSLVDILVNSTGQTRSDVRAAMAAETWYKGEEALSFGLVDEIIGVDKDEKSESEDVGNFSLVDFDNVPETLLNLSGVKELRQLERSLRDAGVSRSKAKIAAQTALASGPREADRDKDRCEDDSIQACTLDTLRQEISDIRLNNRLNRLLRNP